MKKTIFGFSFLSVFLILLAAGCQQEVNSPTQNSAPQSSDPLTMAKGSYTGPSDQLSLQTHLELQEAKSATAKYRDIKNALKDKYKDIDVFIPHMGYHYMKSEYLDANFDPAKPELLVYSPQPVTGKMVLVAVEYAVPQKLSATAPEGFTGSADVWDKNDDFGLWTLHAWIWYKNPNGVFSEYNPLIP